jgi:ribosomal protein S12 methylthiotransferase
VSARRALPVLSAAPSGTARPFVTSAIDATTIRLHTLGCDKNTVDSERLLARLAGAGARPVDGDADVIIINTCGFIDAAREESVDAILDAVRLKDEGRTRAVVAIGCLVQRYKAELIDEIPEVDLFLGLTEVERLVPELRRRGLLVDAPPAAANMEQPLRLMTTAAHSSFLKISEGCDHGCAFCAIPVMRGKHRSTPVDVLVREARQLEAGGAVELSLVSQDTTWYGRDIQRGGGTASDDWFIGRPYDGMAGVDAQAVMLERNAPRSADTGRRDGMLIDLLDALLDQTSMPWFRLFYMYPSGIRQDLVERIAGEPRLVNYLDMPIQHGSDAMLKRMRRPERQATIRERVAWLRSAIPDVALRTTAIVGFPGETEDDFEAMLELLEELRFDNLGAFSYSIEEGTPAATMEGQVPESVKRERLERLLDLQRSVTLEKNESLIGTIHTVLIDRLAGRDIDDDVDADPGRGAIGRTYAQALEVDGVVHIADAGRAGPGEFVRVRITDALEQDLVGKIVDEG